MSDEELPRLRVRYGDFEVELRTTETEELQELLEDLQPILELKKKEAEEARSHVGESRTGFQGS